MTVAELTPLELMGLIHLILLEWVLFYMALRYGYPYLTASRQKAIFWFAFGLFLFLPAYIGLTVINPALPIF